MFFDFFPISRILSMGAFAFVLAMAWAPILSFILYKYKLGKQIRAEGSTPIYTALHKKKEGTPTMGGVLIWLTTLIIILFFWFLSRLNPDLQNLNFLSRAQTLLPLGAFIASALVGLADDTLGVFRIGPQGGGLKMRHRIFVYTIISSFGAWWFYVKLGWNFIHIPFIGDITLGWWYIPVFIFILVATAFSVNETDGLDGLAGGIILIALGAYAAIAYSQGKYDLATFCSIIIGALIAFLWFNIYPARFIMGDTGAMSLGILIGIIAMLTNQFLILPLICFIPLIESLSVIIQLASKKIFKKKVFLSAPIHHHLEAKNWPETQITMRFWIIAGVMAALGLIIAFLDKGFWS